MSKKKKINPVDVGWLLSCRVELLQMTINFNFSAYIFRNINIYFHVPTAVMSRTSRSVFNAVRLSLLRKELRKGYIKNYV